MRNALLALLIASVFSSCASTATAKRRIASPARPEVSSDFLFSEFELSAPIPEIMNLKVGDTVPGDVYKKYPPLQVALTIVYKKYVEEEKAESDRVERPYYDYFRDSEIQMAFSEKIIDSLVAKGFLNTHQLGTAIEIYRRDRVKIEDGFLGYTLRAQSAQHPDPNLCWESVPSELRHSGFRPTPGVLAPIWVIVSQIIIT